MAAAEDLLEQALALPGPERAKLIARLAESLVREPRAAGPRRVFGRAAGSVHLSEDFDAPLADFADIRDP